MIAKWAMTLDGKIAARTGRVAWISGPRSRALVHEVRGRMDAIVVGIGTAIADDPRLTPGPPALGSRPGSSSTRSARLPLEGRLARSAREVPSWSRRRPPRRAIGSSGSRRLGVEVMAFNETAPRPGRGRPPARRAGPSGDDERPGRGGRSGARLVLRRGGGRRGRRLHRPDHRGGLARRSRRPGAWASTSMAEALRLESPTIEPGRRRRPHPGPGRGRAGARGGA